MAFFDLDFLASPEVTKKILSQGDSVFLIDIENSIDLIVYFFRDRWMSQVGVMYVRGQILYYERGQKSTLF